MPGTNHGQEEGDASLRAPRPGLPGGMLAHFLMQVRVVVPGRGVLESRPDCVSAEELLRKLADQVRVTPVHLPPTT